MPPTARPPTSEALLAHAEWVRVLARALVRDPDTADEIAQRTLVAAWSRPPLEAGSLRGWLARCIRNFAHGARRASERRERCEALAARPEALPSAQDVVERASVARELVEHVLALDEPYRTAILLRYFDEEEPSTIARELGIPAATVRTRVARGLAQLRERLDRQHGQRAAWSALFLPLVRHRSPPPPLPLLAMSTSLKLAVPAALGIAALAYLVLRPHPAPRAAPLEALVTRAPEADTALPDPGPTLVPAPAEPASARQAAAPARPARPVAEPVAPRTIGARGRVLDVDGHPRASVELTTSPAGAGTPAREPPAAVSAADGSFAIPAPLPACRIRAQDPELATVLAGVHGDSAEENEIVIVVAEALAGEGFVADESGQPLEDVHVYVDLPADLRARFPVPLDRSLAEPCETRTDAAGAFTLVRVPRVPDARLVAERAGYEPWASRLDEIPGMPLEITLLPPGTRGRVVAGRVVDAGRQPVEGAHVALGLKTMQSEADGSFRFALDGAEHRNRRFGSAPLELRAARRGSLPATYTPPLEGQRPQWPAFVELQLGAPTFAIEGKVLDHDGKARAGLKVWLADSTTFGSSGSELVQLESLLAGYERSFWHFAETGEDGRFRLEGLLDRSYTLEAMEPDTLLRTEAKDVRAGASGVVLRMPTDALFPRVAGVVRGHDGRGIAGASIGPMCDAFRARWQGEVLGTSHDGLRGVRTDEEGRFELANVPRSLVYLRIEGEDILPLEYGRYVEGDARYARTQVRELPLDRIESLEILVDRRAHVQVELGDPAVADEFALLDEGGGELELSVFTGSGRREGLRQPIRAGRSDVVAGTDRGRSLVLFKDGLEVARRPVALVPGETVSVRF